jgi:hypothetical protein
MKSIKHLIGLLLVGSMLLCTSSIALAGTSDSILSIDDGTQIASFYTKELANTFPDFACWDGSSVEHETTYYDFNGDITAYAFNVVNDDVYQGYILISATKDKYPILEFAKGKLPQISSDVKDRSQDTISEYASKHSLSIG